MLIMVNCVLLLHVVVYYFLLEPIVSPASLCMPVYMRDHRGSHSASSFLKTLQQINFIENYDSEVVNGYSMANTFQSH